MKYATMQRICLRFTAAAALLAVVSWLRAEDPANNAASLRLHVVRSIEFVVDHKIAQEYLNELASNVESVQQQLSEELDVPPIEQTVRVYLFARQKEFSRFVLENVRSVSWPETLGRHGIFVLRQGHPYVFLVDGPTTICDLRHEIVHVNLNVSHPGLPIWIDEGLAQCYEAADGSHWNDRAARILLKDVLRRAVPAQSALGRLSTMAQMGSREYAGSWANMNYVLDDEKSGRSALRDYLAALRVSENKADFDFLIPRLERSAILRTAE